MEERFQGQDSRRPRSNPVWWLSSMAVSGALVLFVFLSLYKEGSKTGELTPKIEAPIKTEGVVDLERLKVSTPELVKKGEGLFQVNCASCHGPTGQGDGPRAAELNPRPRNYHKEKFKYGMLASQIFNTVSNGSPGTSMPSFALLPIEDRWALVHFVRSQIPNPPQEDGSSAGGTQVTSTSPTQTTATPQTTTAPAVPGPRIPIQLAMERLAEPEISPGQEVKFQLLGKGAEVFVRECASCHSPAKGTASKSSKRTVLTRGGYTALFAKGAPWACDVSSLQNVLTNGVPAHRVPGLGSLDQLELEALYHYLVELRSQSK